jgi:glyoxylase-like metal-dependent hydrolase (beta-lactamase superfamily II)
MKITERIHALKHTFIIPAAPELNLERFVYSFIIFGKKYIYLIDSGVSSSGKSIINYIKNIGLDVKNIRSLFLTHSHPDHIGSAKYIQEISGCKIFAHINERDWIEDVSKQFFDRPVPGFKSLVNGSVQIDQFLGDNEKIELEENLSIKIFHTPGHSEGSVSLLLEDENALFCGDSILLPGELPIYENFSETISSVDKLKQISGVKILLSSWDEPVYEKEIHNKLNDSLEYLYRIHKTIGEIENRKKYSPLELCRAVVDKLDLPSAAINPLVARSFQSNLEIINRA